MGKVRSYDIKQYNALKNRLGYKIELKAHLVSSRLKRVVKGKHWELEDYWGSFDDDFDKVVEIEYKHYK